jgi:hypothetical protein
LSPLPTFRVEIYGNTMTLYLDGQQVLSAEDPDPSTHGRVTLQNMATATVYFDDVRVVEVVPADS